MKLYSWSIRNSTQKHSVFHSAREMRERERERERGEREREREKRERER